MQLNSLVKNNKKKIRVGRGIGSGRGKTSSMDWQTLELLMFDLYRRIKRIIYSSIVLFGGLR